MYIFIARRIFFAVLLLLAVSLVTYLLFSVLPVDPAALTCGKNCKPDLIAANRIRLGYDKPVLEQYWLFLKGIFVGRDYGMGQAAFSCPAPSLGYSFSQHQCVTTLIGKTFPVTAYLSLGAFVLWMLIGIGSGAVAALNKGKWQDRLANAFTAVGVSLPTFYVGLLVLFSVVIWLGILPFPHYASPFEDPIAFFQAMILPWLTLAVLSAASYTRLTRNGMLEAMNEDFVRLGVAKGLKRSVILRKYVLRSALVPIVTIAGLDFAALLGGAIITESVFTLPGMGKLSIRAVVESDLPVLVGTTMVAAVFIVLANVLVDILYGVLDPRVRTK
jgi:peptide/nickel transport system permease protein